MRTETPRPSTPSSSTLNSSTTRPSKARNGWFVAGIGAVVLLMDGVTGSSSIHALAFGFAMVLAGLIAELTRD